MSDKIFSSLDKGEDSKKEESRVFTDDGVKTVTQFLQEEDDKRKEEEAKEIHETQISEINRDRGKSLKNFKNRLHSATDKFQIRKIEKEVRYKESGYVRHLTKEEYMSEQLQKIRDEYKRLYSEKINNNISRIMAEYVKIEDKSSTSNRTHIKECILLHLTQGPINLKKMIKELDEIMVIKNVPFRFQENRIIVSSKYREVVTGKWESHWILKYLVVHCIDETLYYEFPPPFMKLAGETPELLKSAFFRIRKIDRNRYTEERLLHDFPELKTMVIVDEIKKDDNLIEERKQKYRELREKRKTELIHFWRSTDDIYKLDLCIGIMQAADLYIGTPADWKYFMDKFITTHRNSNARFQSVGNSSMSIVSRQLMSKELAISVLLDMPEKSSRKNEMGLIPESALIPWIDLRKMINPRRVKLGWEMLESYCIEHEAIKQIAKEKVASCYVKKYFKNKTIFTEEVANSENEEKFEGSIYVEEPPPVYVEKSEQVDNSEVKDTKNRRDLLGGFLPVEIDLTDISDSDIDYYWTDLISNKNGVSVLIRILERYKFFTSKNEDEKNNIIHESEKRFLKWRDFQNSIRSKNKEEYSLKDLQDFLDSIKTSEIPENMSETVKKIRKEYFKSYRNVLTVIFSYKVVFSTISDKNIQKLLISLMEGYRKDKEGYRKNNLMIQLSVIEFLKDYDWFNSKTIEDSNELTNDITNRYLYWKKIEQDTYDKEKTEEENVQLLLNRMREVRELFKKIDLEDRDREDENQDDEENEDVSNYSRTSDMNEIVDQMKPIETFDVQAAITQISNAVVENISTDQIGKIVKTAMPGLLRLLWELKKS